MPKFYSLENFSAKVTDIARPYQFRVAFSNGCFEPIANASESVTATVRTASLPGVTINTVPVNYFGMTYNLAGTPTYDPLTCDFIIDGEYKSLLAFRSVIDKVFTYSDGPNWVAPEGYMGDVELKTHGPTTPETTHAEYKLKYAWLSNIGAISLSQEDKDSVMKFTAQIVYSYYTTNKR